MLRSRTFASQRVLCILATRSGVLEVCKIEEEAHG